MSEHVDHREVSDEDAGLRQYTFDVCDFSRDCAAVTVRLDTTRARLLLRDPERLLAEQPERDDHDGRAGRSACRRRSGCTIWSSDRLSTALHAGERSHMSATTLHHVLFPDTYRTQIALPWRHA